MKKEEFIAPQILVREEGILRVGNKSDIKEGDWQYRCTDATESFTFVDLDHGKAQYLVKSILNDLSLFPELRMLQTIQVGLCLILGVVVVLFSIDIATSSSKKATSEVLEILKAQQKVSTQKVDSAQDKIRALINSPVIDPAGADSE